MIYEYSTEGDNHSIKRLRYPKDLDSSKTLNEEDFIHICIFSDKDQSKHHYVAITHVHPFSQIGNTKMEKEYVFHA